MLCIELKVREVFLLMQACREMLLERLTFAFMVCYRRGRALFSFLTKNSYLIPWFSSLKDLPTLNARGRDYRLAWMCGIRSCQGICFSSEPARRISAPSSPNLPMNWTPIGRPDWLHPSGNVMAGCPVTLGSGGVNSDFIAETHVAYVVNVCSHFCVLAKRLW